MSKRRLLWLLILSFSTFTITSTAGAQDNSNAKSTSGGDSAKPSAAYRLDFTMNELEEGKTINTRHYSMNIVPGFTNSNEIKIGTRIPMDGKDGNVQYIDVGTNIWSRLLEQRDALELEVRADISNFANPEQENRTTTPVIRQLRISASTIATAGKPTVVGVVDDPNSKRQFQLEVVVSRLK